MSSEDEYRRHAATCLRLLADLPADQAAKSHLLEMACAWHRLADQADRNSKADLVYEPPLRDSEARRPAAQQQQQNQPKKQQS